MTKKILYILLPILSLIIIILGLILILNLFKDKKEKDNNTDTEYLATTGVVVQVGEGTILLEEKNTTSLFSVTTNSNNYTVGDEVKVYTKDPIRESYPAQVTSSKIEVTYNIANKPDWYYEITYDNFTKKLNMNVSDDDSTVDGEIDYTYGQYLYLINEILRGTEEDSSNLDLIQDNIQYSFISIIDAHDGDTEIALIFYNNKTYISVEIPYVSSNTYKIANLNKLEQLLILNY